jgi:hypothetical protein
LSEGYAHIDVVAAEDDAKQQRHHAVAGVSGAKYPLSLGPSRAAPAPGALGGC